MEEEGGGEKGEGTSINSFRGNPPVRPRSPDFTHLPPMKICFSFRKSNPRRLAEFPFWQKLHRGFRAAQLRGGRREG